jgi:hypothetical protein
VDRQDVGVRETRCKLDLPEEAILADLRRDLGPERFDRYASIVTQVVGKVHNRHAPLPKLLENFVSSIESLCKPFLKRFHLAENALSVASTLPVLA